ncbi:MAG: LTA synthase family protein [Firmicutes bacterium]|nr:LTA synthase family protein [Bacillota bacterium]
MRTLKKLFSRRFRANLPVALVLILLGSVALTVFMFYYMPDRFSLAWDFVVKSGYALFFLNWAPVVLSMLFLYFLTNNVVLACAIPGIIVTLLSVVNFNMVILRSEPFKPLDIFLGGEFLGVAKSIDKGVFITAGAGIAGLLLVMWLALFFIRNTKKRVFLRIAGVALSAGVFLAVNRFYIGDKDLYGSFAISKNMNIYNQLDNFQSRGFLYSFLYTWDNLSIVKPPDYDKYKREIARRVDSFEPDGAPLSGTKPNIVMILGEAFSELAESPAFSFDGYTYPLENYDRIKADSVSGTLIVPNVGGGTADTEFDILTGVCTRHFRDNPYSFSFVNKPYDAMPRWLAGLGYENVAVHPGYGWFYNRNTVYQLLGFGGFLDVSVFDQTKHKGNYVSEDETMAGFIAQYEAHMNKAPNTPFFEFGITIQNHGPYKDKYGYGVPRNFASAADFSADSVNALSNYFVGLADADRGLKTLTDYFDKRAEPVVLVYFGDHIPSFAADVYDAAIPKAGTRYDDQTRLYRTPFIVWRNGAAKKAGATDDPDGRYTQTGISVSSNYFGAWLMGLLGFNGLDPFADFLRGLSVQYPVMLENQFAEYENGERILVPFSEQPEDVALYRSWEYSIVRGN